MKNFGDIDNALKQVCPIQGVSYGRLNDKSTWIIAYHESATDAQKAAADKLLLTLDVVDVPEQPDPILQRLAALEAKVR